MTEGQKDDRGSNLQKSFMINSVSDGVSTNARTFNGYGEIDAYSNKIGATDVYTLSMTRDNAGRITQRIENIKGEVIT